MWRHCNSYISLTESHCRSGAVMVNMSATWGKLYHLAVMIDDTIRIPDTTQVHYAVFQWSYSKSGPTITWSIYLTYIARYCIWHCDEERRTSMLYKEKIPNILPYSSPQWENYGVYLDVRIYGEMSLLSVPYALYSQNKEKRCTMTQIHFIHNTQKQFPRIYVHG